MTQTYDASCFDVTTIAQAKAIILTPEDTSTERRWITETRYLGQLIADNLNPASHHRVLDFGCGIGRLSKEMIESCGCGVVGADTSPSMRALAAAYVKSERFLALSPAFITAVNDVHMALAVWVLQHIPDVNSAIEMIYQKIKPEGRLLVVNCHHRCLPVKSGPWIDDGMDVREILCARFREVTYGQLDPALTSPVTNKAAYWAVYQRRI